MGLHADDLAALGLHLGAVAGGLLVPAGGGARGARGTFRGQLRNSRIPGAATALHSAAKAGSGNDRVGRTHCLIAVLFTTVPVPTATWSYLGNTQP